MRRIGVAVIATLAAAMGMLTGDAIARGDAGAAAGGAVGVVLEVGLAACVAGAPDKKRNQAGPSPDAGETQVAGPG